MNHVEYFASAVVYSLLTVKNVLVNLSYPDVTVSLCQMDEAVARVIDEHALVDLFFYGDHSFTVCLLTVLSLSCLPCVVPDDPTDFKATLALFHNLIESILAYLGSHHPRAITQVLVASWLRRDKLIQAVL